jgi:hypothetical protein
MFFMLFIMRAGLQILADHPRLYWGRDCTPGSDWFRFQVPKGRIWTATDDSVTLPTWLGIPGLRVIFGSRGSVISGRDHRTSRRR